MSSEKHLPTIPQSPLQPADAPPAYSTLVAAATLLESINPAARHSDSHGDDSVNQPIKLADSDALSVNNSVSSPPSFFSSSSASSASTQAPKSHKRSLSSSSTTSLKSKKSWFQFAGSATTSSSKIQNDVRTTVVGLVKDLVRDHSSGSPAAIGILTSCADVCGSHSISLSEILQDKFIENHSPLYWAIVKRPKPEHGGEEDAASVDDTEPDLVSALLSRAGPLKAESIQELRHACLVTSDQVIFQRLRPRFAIPTASAGTDQILLGAQYQHQHRQPDDVRVSIGPGTEGAFEVEFRIVEYHTRMMIAKEIGLEFVARNRIWRFALFITPEGLWHGPPAGSWCVSISLQEPSPPTWLDARLILLSGSSTENVSLSEANEPPSVSVRSKQMLEGPKKDKAAMQLVVPLDRTPLSGIQYTGGSFASSYATLCLKLEAKLNKPAVF